MDLFRIQQDRSLHRATYGYGNDLPMARAELSERVDHERMMMQFGGAGGKCLRIKRVSEFMARVKKRTRAFRIRIHDAIYNDAKIFTMRDAETASRLRSLMLATPFSLVEFNRQYFAILYDLGLRRKG